MTALAKLTRLLRSSDRQPARPPLGVSPTVEWQVAGRCNYDCTYCIQSRATRVGAPEQASVDAIIGEFARLPGKWEIKMSGGEPFAYRGFVRHLITELVAQTPHDISVLTNFSAPLDILERFCRLTGDRLRITSASLHLEFSELETFLAKARAYRELRTEHNPQSTFVVNSVLVPGKVAQQADVKAQVEADGFCYFPQLMKIKGGVFPYAKHEVRHIEALTGGSHDPRAVNRAPSYQGLMCHAGAWYFVVDQTGRAYSCRTAKRFADKPAEDAITPDDPAYMGSLVDGTFALHSEGGVCPYPICPCTVPANRGIVVRKPDAARGR